MELNNIGMSFLKGFFSSCLGAFVALVIFTFSIILFFVIGSSDTYIVKPKSVLQLKLSLPVKELELDDELAQLLPELSDNRTGLLQLKEIIRNAATDTNIEGIYLNVSEIPTGLASITEIRNALIDFKESGKWIIAYSDSYSESSYYLASVATQVFLNPYGTLEFNGLAIEVMHYKKLFDKLDIKPEVFKVGDFKSAVEPYLLERMSDENRLQLNAILSSLQEQMIQGVAAARDIPETRIKEIADKMLVRNAQQALEYGLVDSLYYDDQVKNSIREKLGVEKDKTISMVSYSDYKRSLGDAPTAASDQIAVIVADGEIMPGTSTPQTVGGSTIVNEVRKARINKKVKAIVLRVNSPGGSFQAADAMWRELMLAAEAKPVIASMSDYAASGGYYIAMACDTIVAQPTTITGSIGIFTILFDMSGFLENKIGITSDYVQTGEVGELFTFTRPLTPSEKSIWQTQTNELYDVFAGKAAANRNMSIEALKKIASGRVWTGEQAKENGLVDELGGFDKAVEIAAKAAGITGYQLRYYPEQKSLLQRLTQEAEQTVKTKSLKSELGDLYPWYVQWRKVQQHQGVQARMPFEMIIQ